MKKVNTFLKNVWKDESGQGTAEYILLLVVVVAVIAIFKDKIMAAVKGKAESVGSQIEGFQ